MAKKPPKAHVDKASWNYAGAYRPELTPIASEVCDRAARVSGIRKNVCCDLLIRAWERKSDAELREAIEAEVRADNRALEARRNFL